MSSLRKHSEIIWKVEMQYSCILERLDMAYTVLIGNTMRFSKKIPSHLGKDKHLLRNKLLFKIAGAICLLSQNLKHRIWQGLDCSLGGFKWG